MSLQYITQWHFWVAVLVVAVVINYVWKKFLGGKGNIA